MRKRKWHAKPQDKEKNWKTRKFKAEKLTTEKFRERVALSPFFFGSLCSSGIKQALKAPGKDSKRDLSIPNVRIWNSKNTFLKEWKERTNKKAYSIFYFTIIHPFKFSNLVVI